MQPIQQRKKRLPPTKTTSEVKILPSILEPHEQRKLALHAQYPTIPLDHIHVSTGNGVVLFKNPITNGWCSLPQTVLPYYKEVKK